MCYSFLLALLVCAAGVQAIPQKRDSSSAPQTTTARKIPCKTDENASMCYWTHGRLNFYIGNPSYRIWKVGTTRIVGIHSGPAIRQGSADAIVRDGENPEFPPNLDRVLDAEYRHRVATNSSHVNLTDPVFADYEICPLEPERKGEMQDSCIESARHVVVQRWAGDQSTAVTYPDTY